MVSRLMGITPHGWGHPQVLDTVAAAAYQWRSRLVPEDGGGSEIQRSAAGGGVLGHHGLEPVRQNFGGQSTHERWKPPLEEDAEMPSLF